MPSRSTPPTTSSSAPPTRATWSGSQEVDAARLRQRPRLQGHLRGLVLPALRRLQDRARARARTTPARSTRSRSSRESEENWFFRALRLPGARSSGCTRSGPTSSSRTSAATRRSRSSRAGSQDVSLSRPKLNWGVPVPWDPEQVMYVWFDALLNYYTALALRPRGRGPDRALLAGQLHVIAKDILKFHAVYWPAFLMAAGIELPQRDVHPRLPADGREEDVEVARQRARPVRGDRALRRRRAALLLLPRGLASARTARSPPAGFEARYETELANDYGNLASRTLAMIEPLPRRRRARGRGSTRCSAEERSTGVGRPASASCSTGPS